MEAGVSPRRRVGWLAVWAVALVGCASPGGQSSAPAADAATDSRADVPAAAGAPAGEEPATAAPREVADERATDRAGRPAVVPESVAGYRSPREIEAVAEPTRIRIPAIGVDSDLDRLGRNADGTVEVPDDFARAGWYADGARPGQQGPAVILGHVDSRAGPAVFYRLVELEPGDEVLVDREDGSTATFVVDRVERHPKDAFPTEEVYFPTLESRLTLVTCGGEFDRSAGSYRDNVIAFASPGG